jgi:anaerobic magnesium-protoporphyrin IX monomethyl ester cyclase
MTSEQGLPKSACNKTIVLAVPPSASHRTSEGNLAIALLASILRANGWDVTLFDAWLLDWSAYKLATEIAKVPNLLWVGFSCYKTNLIGAAATINHLKGLGVGVPFLAGGYGPTFEPDAFLKAGFDIAAIGEGERTLLDLSNAIAEGDDLSAVPGIVYLDSAGTRFFTGSPRIMLDLEEAPLPSTDLMVHVIESKSALHIETSRGCRGGCTYCSIVAFGQKSGTPKWRQKSIGRIVEELVALSRIGACTIKVIDDSFIEPPRDATWARTLASAIRQHGLRVNLRGQIRADRVNDELIANLVDRYLSALLSARDAWIEHLNAVYCALLFMGHA